MNVKKIIGVMVCALLICLTSTACGDEAPVPSPTLPPQVLTLSEQFRNNIRDEEGAYVFCKISLEAYTEDELAILTANMAYIRDIINVVLRSKTLEELRDDNAIENLSAELMARIAEALELNGLRGVYFENYYTVP